VNTQYWQGANSSAPVFFYIEGEGTGSPYDVVQGQHVELAAQVRSTGWGGAIECVFAHSEARGYGV